MIDHSSPRTAGFNMNSLLTLINKRFALAAVLVACTAGLAMGQPPVSGEMKRQLLADLDTLRDALAESATSTDRRSIEAIKFDIAPITTGALHAYALDTGTISLGEHFVAGLHLYADAVAVEIEFDRPGLAATYFDYVHVQRLYRNPRIPEVADFARLNRGELQRYEFDRAFQEMRARLSVAALSFVVAHEIGHIVSAGFYDEGASLGRVREIERAADNYAIQLMIDAGFQPYAGIMVANTYLNMFESPFPKDGTAIHTPSLERTLRAFDYAVFYAERSGADVPAGVDGLRESIVDLKESREVSAEQLYDEMLNAPPGSMHPRLIFQIGRMFFEGVTTDVDRQKGFSLFVISIANPRAQYHPAFVWIGYCHEHGLGTPRNARKALEAYRSADLAGVTEGRLRFRKLQRELEK